MKFALRPGALILLIGWLVALPVRAALGPDDPAVKLLPLTPEITAAARKALQNCPPPAKGIHAGVNQNGVYALMGDFLHNGGVFAVVDNKANVIVCEWKNSSWQPVSAIDLAPAWKGPGSDANPETSQSIIAPRPFWALNLQKRFLLVIASDPEKYHQNYLIILLSDRGDRIMDVDNSYSWPPSIEEGYLVTADASRNKAEYGENYFSWIENDKLVVKKSWAEYCPWHSGGDYPDFEWNTVSSDGDSYTIVSGEYVKSEPLANWVIYQGDLSDKIRDGMGELAKPPPPFATISFKLKPGKPPDSMDAEGELAYLFEKLTGLPRRLYRLGNDTVPGDPPTKKIESRESVKVTGAESIAKKFAPIPR